MRLPDDFQTEKHDAAGAASVVRKVARLEWRDETGDHGATIERLTLVGSATSADLVVSHPTVSRLHAELEPRADGLWIRDLGSRNGTYIHGVRVTNARIPDGAKVQIGAAALTYNPAATETRVDLWPEGRFGPLVGSSVIMRELFATLARIASSDSTALIFGETGTGKELVAQAIHDASARAQGPFVVVDCAALPEQLLQSELFGYSKGAFTGATTSREGAIESASGGTVFLDEIGELPLRMQPALLRVLESRTVRRLGESTHRRIDVRFVSATHRDLRSMVAAGAFREDLYFRLAVLPVTVPPLRQRMDDVALLIEHFLPAASTQTHHDLLREILDRPWLGNVRELRNFVERAATFGAKQALAMSEPDAMGSVPPPSPSSRPLSMLTPPAFLPTQARPQTLSGPPELFEKPYREFRDEVEAEYIQRLLERHGGNLAAAAHAAGIDRTYIYRLVRKHRR